MPRVNASASVSALPLPQAAFLRVLVMPAYTLAYAATYPRHVAWSLAFLLLPFLVDLTETVSPPEARQPHAASRATRLLMGGLLVTLFLLHWLTLGLAASRVAEGGVLDLRAFTLTVLLIMASSLSGAVTGHELIHKKSAAARLAGRLLLASIWYEHFATEHPHGHHARAGEHDDVGTARLGETFLRFLRRAAPEQLARAWAMERARLADRSAPVRVLGNRVLQGLAVETLMTAAFFVLFGPLGGGLFLLQAAVVSVLFQVVSYIEHWGLDGENGVIAWDAEKRSSLFSMLGLSRHADHHEHPGRSFYELEHRPESPKLPFGYATMIGLALLQNRKFRAVMTDALREHGLVRQPASMSAAAE